ncbi:hypothetical protein CPB83DRAFT_890738 [Crepidotus variabilis]|uniref:F-box domain-containing protein n=1 Tax=Crepidotus variabilis TaxID=179855 RepID=A0A9P6EPI8_9AGAR|nr:hypothetical protein CPB83DRAFT_890738 [Crepidotus variabilis]
MFAPVKSKFHLTQRDAFEVLNYAEYEQVVQQIEERAPNKPIVVTCDIREVTKALSVNGEGDNAEYKNHRTLGLSSIPIDVLTMILGLLRPPDMIQARLTCKRIRDVSLTRAVWLDAVMSMMRDHGIPLSTFPLPKLNQRTLERIALSSREFRWKLKVASESPTKTLSPCSAQYALSEPTEKELTALGIQELLHYQWIDLVPGGRFMISARLVHTVNGRWLHLIQLWDLGVWCWSQRPRSTASYVTNDPKEGHTFVHWQKDRISMGCQPNGKISLIIYREQINALTHRPDCAIILLLVDPCDPHPQFAHFASAYQPDRMFLYHYWYDAFILGVSSSYAMFWDMQKPSVAAWKVTDKVRVTGISEWAIPVELDAKGITTNHLPVCTFANLMCGMPAGPAAERLHMLPFDPFAHSSTRPDFIVLFQHTNLAVYRIETHSSNSDWQTQTSHLFPRCIQRFPQKFDIAKAYYSPARACDGQIVFTSSTLAANAEVQIHLAPTDSKTAPVGCVKTKWMAPHRATVTTHTLCPVSGRLCILTKSNEIVILDFLEAMDSLSLE